MESISLNKASSFSYNADLFALVSVDGRLRIWDTISGRLIHEFSPKAVAQSSCTCLCWTRNDRVNTSHEPAKKKKKKKEKDASQHPTLAIGTTNGQIITFNINTGEGQAYTECSSQNHAVTGITYAHGNEALYTCTGKDRYIYEWDHSKQTYQMKWKGDKIAVRSVCASESGKTLLSAGRTLKLWDLENKTLLQKFSGHSHGVTVIHFTSFRSTVTSDKAHEDDGLYFLSAASEERTISVWRINSKQQLNSPVASFMLSDPLVTVDSCFVEHDEKPLKICAGCENGNVHIFENMLNGRTTKSISCTKTISFKQKESKKSKPTNATLLSLSFQKDMNVNVVLGPKIKPLFENMNLSEVTDEEEIIKDISESYLNAASDKVKDNVTNADTSKVKKAVSNTNFMPLATKRALNSSIVIDVNGNESDRQKTETAEHILSLEERLTDVTPKDTKTEKKVTTVVASAGSFTQMLTQALHTNDDILLSEILFVKSTTENVLKNTIKRLPSNLVPALLKFIVTKLQQNPSRSKQLTVWLRLIIGIHLVYLLTNDEIINLLGTLYQHLKEQQEIQPQLANIQGKINFLVMSSLWRKEEISDEEMDNPGVVFNDDDSDNETGELFKRKSNAEKPDGNDSDVDDNSSVGSDDKSLDSDCVGDSDSVGDEEQNMTDDESSENDVDENDEE